MKAQTLIVRLADEGCAVKFITRHDGQLMNAVADTQATMFTTEKEAHRTAKSYGLAESAYRVEPLTADPVATNKN